LLQAEEGASDVTIAATLHVGVATVERTRKRLVEEGLDQGKRASRAVKTEELPQVGKRPAGPLAFDFQRTFAGIAT
jgi:transposase